MHRIVLLPLPGQKTAVIVPVRRGDYVVGRSASCDIVICDGSVSRRHARLSLNGTELSITDLASRFGTFIDDRRIESSTVRVGQVIRFGAAPYRVAVATEDEVAAALENDEVETRNPRFEETSVEAQLLTPSQQRVYDLMIDGVSEAEIAARLSLSVHTVHTHAKAIYTRFGVHSRAELLAQRIRVDRQA